MLGDSKVFSYLSRNDPGGIDLPGGYAGNVILFYNIGAFLAYRAGTVKLPNNTRKAFSSRHTPFKLILNKYIYVYIYTHMAVLQRLLKPSYQFYHTKDMLSASQQSL